MTATEQQLWLEQVANDYIRHHSYTGAKYMPRSQYLSGIIVDDPLGPSKPVKKDYNTISVRYLRGPNVHKAYTYRVKKGVKLHLGQEVIVPTQMDGYVAQNVAVVVEIHSKPQDNGPYDYKFVYGTVKQL